MDRLTSPAEGYCEAYCDLYNQCFDKDPDVCVRKNEHAMYEALDMVEGFVPLQRLMELGFHDKHNRVVVLPCAIGTKLYRVTHPYRQAPKVTEYVVKGFRTSGKKHRLQLEVAVNGVPGTNFMYYHQFKTTREEAEAELNRGGSSHA